MYFKFTMDNRGNYVYSERIIMADFYDINDKDIDGMLNYLRIFEPENAIREYAIEFLKFLKLSYRRTGRFEPDELPELLKDFKNSKQNPAELNDDLNKS